MLAEASVVHPKSHDESTKIGKDTSIRFPEGIHPRKQRVPMPQRGHLCSTGFCWTSVSGFGDVGARNSFWQRRSAERRWGCARNPKWRILTKPGGRM